MYTAPNISRWKGPSCRESAGYAALHPVIVSPSYPAPTPAARRYLHAAPLEVDCALQPAAGRGSARPSRRLGRSAGHAHMAWSVVLKWCHSTVRPAGGSQTAVAAGHGKHFKHPPHLGKWLILQNSNTSGSTWHGRRTSVSLHAEHPHRTLVSPVWWMSPPLSGPVTHRAISPVTHHCSWQPPPSATLAESAPASFANPSSFRRPVDKHQRRRRLRALLERVFTFRALGDRSTQHELYATSVAWGWVREVTLPRAGEPNGGQPLGRLPVPSLSSRSDMR